MKKNYSNISIIPDKKLRTLRNNLNNRLESFKKGSEKALSPSHMLHGQDQAECEKLLERIQVEMRKRAKA